MTKRNKEGIIRCDWFECQETNSLIEITCLQSFCRLHYDMIGFSTKRFRTCEPLWRKELK
jgi:hypothetical protein